MFWITTLLLLLICAQFYNLFYFHFFTLFQVHGCLLVGLRLHQLNRHNNQCPLQQRQPPHLPQQLPQWHLRPEPLRNTPLNRTSLCQPLGTCLISMGVTHLQGVLVGYPEVIPDMHPPYHLVITMVGTGCHRLKGTPLRGNSPHLEDSTLDVNRRIIS